MTFLKKEYENTNTFEFHHLRNKRSERRSVFGDDMTSILGECAELDLFKIFGMGYEQLLNMDYTEFRALCEFAAEVRRTKRKITDEIKNSTGGIPLDAYSV